MLQNSTTNSSGGVTDPNSPPLVSVIVGSRNRVELLHRTLKAIEAQEYKNLQVIVVDDGSSAEAIAANRPFFDSLDNRFEWYVSETPGSEPTGPSATRNRAIKLVRGEYIAFCDDDDYWIASDHLSIAIQSLRHYDADFFFANQKGSMNGKITVTRWFRRSPLLDAADSPDGDPNIVDVKPHEMAQVLRHSQIHLNTIVIERALLDRTGNFLEEVEFGEDLDQMFRFVDRAKRLLYRRDPVAIYRFPTGDSVSLKSSKIANSAQMLVAMSHAERNCKKSWVNKVARARSSWIHGEMAVMERGVGHRGAAIKHALAGFWTYPRLGSFVRLCKQVLPGFGPRTSNKAAL